MNFLTLHHDHHPTAVTQNPIINNNNNNDDNLMRCSSLSLCSSTAAALEGPPLYYTSSSPSFSAWVSPTSPSPRGSNSKRVRSLLEKMRKVKRLLEEREAVSNKGSMLKILECLQELKNNFGSNADREAPRSYGSKKWNMLETDSVDGDDRPQMDAQLSSKSAPHKRRNSWDSKFHTILRGTTLTGNLGPDVKVSELMKLNSLDKAPTQLLFSMVDKVLDESLERKCGDVPHQNNLRKIREGKYQSRVKALETLAVGAAEENEVTVNHLQGMKIEAVAANDNNAKEKDKMSGDYWEKVSWERDGDNVMIEIQCPCNNSSHVLFKGHHCYYKL